MPAKSGKIPNTSGDNGMASFSPEKRQSPRVHFRESVQLRFRDTQQVLGSLGFDISKTGLRVRTPEFVPLKTVIDMDVALSPERIVTCTGLVVWLKLIPFSENYEMGLVFEDSKTFLSVQPAIQRFIYQNK